jgi:hypothetical protein
MRENALKEFEALDSKVDAMFSAINNAGATSFHSVMPITIHFDASFIKIVNKEAQLSDEGKEKIKDKCQIKIRTEDQNEFYNRSQNLVDAYKKVADFIKEKNPKITQPPFPGVFLQNSGQGRFTETRGELVIRPQHILFGI